MQKQVQQKLGNKVIDDVEMKNFNDQNDSNNQLFSQNGLHPIEMFWDNLKITATIQVNKKEKQEKVLLKNIKGILRPGQFTAILGPSGSGKTTLLNFLSGRLASPNLRIQGNLQINNENVKDLKQIQGHFAYVQQDDVLNETFTPREAFMFAAKLRLNLKPDEITRRVNDLIVQLGLTNCCDTMIGGQLFRGISGGERKRTSIGVEILTNPSLIFLDEPTTGLDSATAADVMKLLINIAKQSGRTVVSTIHQPSSDVFKNFDQLLLLCDGHIIFQGDSDKAIQHFSKLGQTCQKLENPANFLMKIMNPDGLLIDKFQQNENTNSIVIDDNVIQEFQERIQKYLQVYFETDQYINMGPQKGLETFQQLKDAVAKKENSWFNQFSLILHRCFLDLKRNSFRLQLQIGMSLFMCTLSSILYYEMGSGRAQVQNKFGLTFFTAAIMGFSGLQSALLTFNIERALFLRERLNKSYNVSPYFWGKSLGELPLQSVLPLFYSLIIYFVCGLNTAYTEKWFIYCKFISLKFQDATCIGIYQSASSYGFIVSIFISNFELAQALAPAIFIPMILFSGFFVKTDKLFAFFKLFEYLSPFRYGFQALLQNELSDLPQLKIDCSCDPLAEQNFQESLWENIMALYILMIALRVVASYGLLLISEPKLVTLEDAEDKKKVE